MGAGHLGVLQLRDRLASRDAPQHEVTYDVTPNSRTFPVDRQRAVGPWMCWMCAILPDNMTSVEMKQRLKRPLISRFLNTSLALYLNSI